MFACEVTAVETILYFSMMFPHNQCKNIMLQIYFNLKLDQLYMPYVSSL